MTDTETSPVMATPARLGWRRRKPALIWCAEGPEADIGFIPIFPHCADELEGKEIVWDIARLAASVRQPGAYYVFNCICGEELDADLEMPVLVSFPTAFSVAWELDIQKCAPALAEGLGESGFIRLVFARDDYERDVRKLVQAMQEAAAQRIAIEDWLDGGERAGLLQRYPPGTCVVAGESEPCYGDRGLEELLALDVAAPWPRAPLLAPGSTLEIGVWGSTLFRVRGGDIEEPCERWLSSYISRWQLWMAYERWTDTLSSRRGVSVQAAPGYNDFVLAKGVSAEASHRAGEAFAMAFRRALAEGDTAPGVEVRYIMPNF